MAAETMEQRLAEKLGLSFTDGDEWLQSTDSGEGFFVGNGCVTNAQRSKGDV